ncbi:MAG: tRNA lysidine(34) synthetase TilS [Campylobacterota bacterium]|nr:tRNA lysidine(34) synthetase TilS [Campylobacterota bacterium]
MNNIKIDILTNKNLLAFSGGVDSSALFFILLENNIQFDIAIVDYNQRVQSKDEVIYATQLAHKYNKKCFISTYENKKFSEKDARDFRYNFFEEIITKESYNSLITAHQLDDKLEWFLMQFTKGAGLSELLSFEEEVKKDNYLLLKPLLSYTKKDLLIYLNNNNIKYFIDHTNQDDKYKRNYFRNNFSNKLLDEFTNGIKNSFQYLEKDKHSLESDHFVKKHDLLSIYKFNGDNNIAIRIIDKEIKKRGILISKATRDEIIKQKEIVISNKIAVSIYQNFIYISPYLTTNMDKKFKEKCRINKIPKNIRAYLSTIENFSF